MDIGIPKETKPSEKRVSLLPEHVSELVQVGHQIYVERSAGLAAGHPDRQYEDAGAIVRRNVLECGLIVAVKPPPPQTLHAHQTLMAYLHVHKGQNPSLLRSLLRSGVTAYAYEEIRDHRGARLVNLGFEAGIVAAYEGLRVFRNLVIPHRQRSPHLKMPSVWNIGTVDGVLNVLSSIKVQCDCAVVIMGDGCVSRGVQYALLQTDLVPLVLTRKETSHIITYLPFVDILINAVDWHPSQGHIVTRRYLSLMKSSTLIVDVSCDDGGAIETSRPQTWNLPVYKCEDITHFVVDNLPSAIASDASARLGRMILPHVTAVANGHVLPSGLEASQGRLVG